MKRQHRSLQRKRNAPRTGTGWYRPYAALFCASLILSLLLSLAFPYGILTPETLAYLWLAKDFHWWDVNMVDWFRTVPYGWVLLLATHFPSPSSAVYWMQAVLFALCICLAFRLFRAFVSSERMAFVLATALLLYEFLTMRVFFMNLVMTTDVFYSHLIFIGMMLSLIGWTEGRAQISILGYALLGFAAFLRPIGIVLLPLWGPAAIIIFTRAGAKTLWRVHWASLVSAVVLITAPTALWAVRNAVVYGHLSVTALGPHEFLSHVLPLLRDGDAVFTDQTTNKAFLATVRSHERAFGTNHNDYSWSGTQENPSIFEFFETMTPVYRQTKGTMDWVAVARSRFEMAPLVRQTAWQIVRLHPGEFLDRVLREYVLLYSPFHVFQSPMENPGSDITSIYQDIVSMGEYRDILSDLYPPDGNPDLSKSSSPIRGFILTLFSPIKHTLAKAGPPLGAVFAHAVFLAGIISLIVLANRRRSSAMTQHRTILIAMMLLFLTVAVHYLATGLTETALYRYSLPGILPLHMMYLLGILMLLKTSWNKTVDRSHRQ